MICTGYQIGSADGEDCVRIHCPGCDEAEKLRAEYAAAMKTLTAALLKERAEAEKLRADNERLRAHHADAAEARGLLQRLIKWNQSSPLAQTIDHARAFLARTAGTQDNQKLSDPRARAIIEAATVAGTYHLSVVDDTTTHAGSMQECKLGCWVRTAGTPPLAEPGPAWHMGVGMRPGTRCVKHADEMHFTHDYEPGHAARWALQHNIGRCGYVEPATESSRTPKEPTPFRAECDHKLNPCPGCGAHQNE